MSICPCAMGAVQGGPASSNKTSIKRKKTQPRHLVGDKDRPVNITADIHRMIKVVPLGQIGALSVEHLHAVILAIGDKDAIFGIDPDCMRGGEFSGRRTGIPPRHLQLTFGREPMHAGISVAVARIDFAVGSDGDIRRMVERLAGFAGDF